MIRFDWMRGPLRDEAAGDGADGGGGKAAFDPAAFQAALMAEVNKTINGVVKNLKKELAPKPDPDPKPDPEPDPKPDDKAKPDFQTKQLQEQVRKLTEKFESADKARKEAEDKAKSEKLRTTLREELGKAGVDPKKIDAAMRIFKDDVRYNDSDEIIAGSDEAPLAAYLESVISDYDYLLPPKQVGGAGATSGNKRGVAIDISDIKPGMTKEQEAAALAEIRRALGK
jgi:hypothetical protein